MPKYTIIEKLRSPQGETVIRSFVEAENEEKAVEIIHNDLKKHEEFSECEPFGNPKIKLYEEGDECGPIQYEPPTIEELLSKFNRHDSTLNTQNGLLSFVAIVNALTLLIVVATILIGLL